jgi:1,4-dihydroxy-6-naphthoate synthase
MTPDPILLGHSPDADDAFMFFGLAKDLVDTEGLRFEHVLQDIETLNQRALKGELHVTAVSLHGFAFVRQRYGLLRCGASIGDGYGPVVISSKAMRPAELRGRRIGVPGTRTTAYLAMRLHTPEFTEVVLPFNEVQHAVRRGEVDAGVIIHEGQLTWAEEGFQRVVDLGAWWKQETRCPLPLGANAVRLDLGQPLMQKIGRVLERTIRYGLEHRSAGVDHAMTYARGLARDRADQFIGMYVNDYTLDFGDAGKEGVRQLMRRGIAAGLLPKGPVDPVFVDAES